MTEPTAPTFPPLNDPRYVEPTSVAEFKQRAASFTKDAPGTLFDVQQLFGDLIARVEALTNVLWPFASHAMALSNMQMCLAADGRPDEPPGGTWVNGLKSSQLQCNPLIFYFAADAFGRGAVEARMLELFNKLQAAQKAAKEKADHEANTSLVGPVGGPVEGQVH